MVELIVLKDQGDPLWEELQGLRYEVLRKPLGMKPTRPHPLDTVDSIHVIAREQGRVIGVASFSPELQSEPSRGRLYQMAVSPEKQGSGIGKKIVMRVLDEARGRGFHRVHLHARNHAVPFYRKCGFVEVGERFIEISMEHAEMTINL